MACRVDTAPLLSGACVVSAYTGHGVPGSAVPSTGTHGPSPIYNDLALPADAGKEYRWAIVTPPASGSLVIYEDGSYAFTAPGSGSYGYTYRLWEDGADKGTAAVTLSVAAVVTGVAAMQGASTGVFSAGGVMSASIGGAASLTGSAVGEIAASGVFAGPVGIAGAADILGSTSGFVAASGAIAAQIACTAALQAAPVGAFAAHGSLSTDIGGTAALQGASVGSVTATGAIVGPEVITASAAMFGQAAGSFAALITLPPDPVPMGGGDMLSELRARRARYLLAEAKILEAQEYQIGHGLTARRNRRADLEQVREEIARLDAAIAAAEASAIRGGRRGLVYLR